MDKQEFRKQFDILTSQLSAKDRCEVMGATLIALAEGQPTERLKEILRNITLYEAKRRLNVANLGNNATGIRNRYPNRPCLYFLQNPD